MPRRKRRGEAKEGRRKGEKRRTTPLSALVTTIFALLANFNVLNVSVACLSSGLIVQTTATLEFPLNAGWRSRVSFESRYGMCAEECWEEGSVSLPITVPRVRRERLMKEPSLRRSAWPVADSEPARSIRFWKGERGSERVGKKRRSGKVRKETSGGRREGTNQL
jgi:hypothetical protein